MKLVSIIVPIYKVEEYLDRCVQSILKQTYSNFELILVDDGSPDNSGIMCDEYMKKDERIKVVHKENGGLSDARNAGLKIAQGEYIVFVDSDDWLAKEYLEILVATLERTQSDIVECNIVRASKYEEEIKTKGEYEEISYSPIEALKLLIQDNIFHQYVWNKIYTKESINSLLFEKGKLNEDEFWTYQIFGNSKKIVKIDIPLYFYYQRENSIMGAGYNIRRLDAIEAKVIRQKYIEEKYPELSNMAKINLVQSCIYSGQMILKYLSLDEKNNAKKILNKVNKRYVLSVKEILSIKGRGKLWLMLAKINFWGTCYIKNMFKRGF